MNTNENEWEAGGATPAGASAPMARRRFLMCCAVLGGGALPLLRNAADGPAPGDRTGPGPRELALAQADLYRPHDLAG